MIPATWFDAYPFGVAVWWMTAASTRGAITGRPLRSFSSAPHAARGTIGGCAAFARAATRNVGSGPGLTTIAFRSRTRPRTRIWSRADDPNHAASDIHGAFALRSRALARSARSTACQAPNLPVACALRISRRALRVPRQCRPASEKPPFTRSDLSVVQWAAVVAFATRADAVEAAFSGTGITRTEPAAPAAAGATRATSTAAARAARGWGRSADTGSGVVPGERARTHPRR